MDFAAHRLAERSEAFCLKHALICERSGHIAGMMLGYRLPGQANTAEIHELCPTLRPEFDLVGHMPGGFYLNTLALYPDDRKCGLGTLLLAAAERKARAAHCTSLLLEVERGNVPGIRFYRRHGFGLWPGVFGAQTNGAPMLVLEKRL